MATQETAQDWHPRERKAKQGGNSATENDHSIGTSIWGIGSGCRFTRGPNDLEFGPKGPDPNDAEDRPIRPREKQGRRHQYERRPNEMRLSCGALKKDSFLNLRAPPASSAC